MKTPWMMLALPVAVLVITAVSSSQPKVNVVKNPQTVTLHDLASYFRA